MNEKENLIHDIQMSFSKLHSEEQPFAYEALGKLVAAHEAEVEKLLDIINEMQLAINDPTVQFEEMVMLSLKAKRALTPYQKQPCEECGGTGDVMLDRNDDGNSVLCPCPSCKGRRYHWRR